MSIDQREPGNGRLRHNTQRKNYAIAGTVAGVGLATSFFAGYSISEGNRPAPVFDCSKGSGGSLSLEIPKGGAYSMESINGSPAVLMKSLGGEVKVAVKDIKGNKITLGIPAKVEDEYTIFEINKSDEKDPYVVVNATCKPKNSSSPVPKASK